MRHLLLMAALSGCGGQSAQAPAPASTGEAAAAPAPDAKRAPDFTLNDSEGKPVALHDLLKQGPVILAFFPKAFTGG